jgi:hypothetical protein
MELQLDQQVSVGSEKLGSLDNYGSTLENVPHV